MAKQKLQEIYGSSKMAQDEYSNRYVLFQDALAARIPGCCVNCAKTVEEYWYNIDKNQIVCRNCVEVVEDLSARTECTICGTTNCKCLKYGL